MGASTRFNFQLQSLIGIKKFTLKEATRYWLEKLIHQFNATTIMSIAWHLSIPNSLHDQFDLQKYSRKLSLESNHAHVTEPS